MSEEIKNTRRKFHTDIECVPTGYANGKATNANKDNEMYNKFRKNGTFERKQPNIK